jgi:hypothetical protein
MANLAITNTIKNLDQLVVTYEASQSSDRWMNENNKGDFFYCLFF